MRPGKTIGHVTVIRRGDKQRRRSTAGIPPIFTDERLARTMADEVIDGTVRQSTLVEVAEGDGEHSAAAKRALEILRDEVTPVVDW